MIYNFRKNRVLFIVFSDEIRLGFHQILGCYTLRLVTSCRIVTTPARCLFVTRVARAPLRPRMSSPATVLFATLVLIAQSLLITRNYTSCHSHSLLILFQALPDILSKLLFSVLASALHIVHVLEEAFVVRLQDWGDVRA